MYKIQSFETKAGMSKATGKNFTIHYAIAEDMETGLVQRINLGFKNTFAVGDTITSIEKNKYNEFVPKVGTTSPDSSKGFTVKPEQSGGGGYSGRAAGRPFPVPKDSGELSIIRQSALKAAIDTVSAYNNNYLGKETNSDVSLIEFVEQILEVAYTYTDFSSGHRELKAIGDKFETKGN